MTTTTGRERERGEVRRDDGSGAHVEDAGLLKIADGRGLDDVPDEEPLHGLVLGHHRAGRFAEHALDLMIGRRRGRRRQRRRRQSASNDAGYSKP
jgi:hypothetical protein